MESKEGRGQNQSTYEGTKDESLVFEEEMFLSMEPSREHFKNRNPGLRNSRNTEFSTRSPSTMLRVQSIAAKTEFSFRSPAFMIGAYLCGICLIVALHTYYHRLDGTRVGSERDISRLP